MIRQGIRVGFTGAGGTGKTTTAKAVSEKMNAPLIKSASRAVYEERDLTEAKCLALPDEEKFLLQFDIFDKKIDLDLNTFGYVADRTLLDHWAYCLMYCSAFMDNLQFAKFEEKVRVHMLSTYSHIFYFPFGYWFPEKGDGVRQDSHAWQSAIDAIIVGYIQRWRLPVIEVPQVNGPEGRTDFVVRKVSSR